MDERCPPDVLSEFVEILNDFNKIAGCSSFMEVLNKARFVEDAYKKKRKSDRHTDRDEQQQRRDNCAAQDNHTLSVGSKGVGKGGYEQQYRDWMMPAFGSYFNNSFAFFTLAKETRRTPCGFVRQWSSLCRPKFCPN